MNTNGNLYTVIYSAIIVVVVAALLAFASESLKSRQDANVKAETISQMLAAAQFYTKQELEEMGNAKVLEEYSKNIEKAFIIDASGNEKRALETKGHIELADGLKAQNKLIKKGLDAELELPVYVFNKEGRKVTVVPCYGAGLWGPIWGYMAFEEDLATIIGVYFDHESETPGLGAKIKDEPSFREDFVGKTADFSAGKIFEIVKHGMTESKRNAIDGITGATMTTKGLDNAINTWLAAYKPYLTENSGASADSECCEGGDEGSVEEGCKDAGKSEEESGASNQSKQ